MRSHYIYRYYIYLLVYIHIHSYILIAIHNIYILTLSHARAVKRVCHFFIFLNSKTDMDNEEHLQDLKTRAEELHSYLPPEAKQMAALRSKYDKLAMEALYAAAAGDITSYDDLQREFIRILLRFDDEALQLTPQPQLPPPDLETLSEETRKAEAAGKPLKQFAYDFCQIYVSIELDTPQLPST